MFDEKFNLKLTDYLDMSFRKIQSEEKYQELLDSGYMSPEISSGQSDPIFEHKADIWSLGIIFYELFIGFEKN
jgi:serine/threonine protein kinase